MKMINKLFFLMLFFLVIIDNVTSKSNQNDKIPIRKLLDKNSDNNRIMCRNELTGEELDW
jgi:hypothetical protein